MAPGFVPEAVRGAEVAPGSGQLGHGDQDGGEVAFVAQLLEQGEAPALQLPRECDVVLFPCGDQAEVVGGPGDAKLVVQAVAYCQTFLEHDPGVVVPPDKVENKAALEQRCCSERLILRCGGELDGL